MTARPAELGGRSAQPLCLHYYKILLLNALTNTRMKVQQNIKSRSYQIADLRKPAGTTGGAGEHFG